MGNLTYTDGERSITFDMDNKENMAAFNEAMVKQQDAMAEYMDKLQKELGVSDSCAADVFYLRTRSRHTPELEAELIRLHKAGTPPNICDFGHYQNTDMG